MTRSLTLSKFRHSCLLIEVDDTRLLLDPGIYSSGFEGLTDIAGVLITHQHYDHLDVGRLRAVLEVNPEAEVIADTASTAQLAEAGITARPVKGGDAIEVGGVPIAVYGDEHALIAPGLPLLPNVGYAVDGLFAYAGDAYVSPPEPVQVVGIPTAAAWLKAGETIGFLKQLRPKVVVPLHEAMLASTDVFYAIYRGFAEAQKTTFYDLDNGQPATF